jgi:DNA-directed RNA polymerase subunit M/transcription elongation factor TFIIS
MPVILPENNVYVDRLSKIECIKCGNKELEYWQSQICLADED